MSDALTLPEQVMIAAAAVVCVSMGGEVERRALAMLAEVLPDVEIKATDGKGVFDATRPTEAVRVYAVSLTSKAARGCLAREYEDARFLLKRAVEHFFEQRAASAYTRWRNAVADAAGR
jgi:hypothetical protein